MAVSRATAATIAPMALGLLILLLSSCCSARPTAGAQAEFNARAQMGASLAMDAGQVTPMASACSSAQVAAQLVPCLPAARSNPAPPTHECCALVHSLSADCLCSCLQSPLAKMEGVNFATALELPHKCKRAVPPGTKCAGVSVPGWAS